MKLNGEASIVIAGEAGQGIQALETILVKTLKDEGFHVFATKEYMSRVRGGVNSTELRISSGRVRSHIDRIDLFIPFEKMALTRLEKRITKNTVILGEKEKLDDDRVVDVPFGKMASAQGSPLFANLAAVGMVCGILGVAKEKLAARIATYFAGKPDEVRDKNALVAQTGFDAGKALLARGAVSGRIEKDASVSGEPLLSGTDAVALGCLAGACNAVFAYPMTPSSGVFTAMAAYTKDVDLLVEQAEDEIAAMNMALGAWYAGARALVSTSGGGFALMTEGLSLGGMTETPVVVHLAQRPGPATGLPTRTEQGDLNLALYAGHGFFPRILLAPGSVEQAFELSALAFNLADKFQVPVFILTDQYLVDSYYNVPPIDASRTKPEPAIVETSEGYLRYRITESGVSPRGVPGYGKGTVCSDSDEHDESGRITEDLENVRVPMTEKRMRKETQILGEAIEPELIGGGDFETLVVGWGSVYNTVIEAIKVSGSKTTSFLFFPQIYPVPPGARRLLERSKKIIAIENNEKGQFADLLELTFGIPLKNRILKFDGMPFSVEEVAARLGV